MAATLLVLLSVGTYFAGAHPITIDGTSGDWFARAPLADDTGVVARNAAAAEEGEHIWADRAGDERTALASPDPRVDLTGVRYTATATNLNVLVKVASLPVTTGDGAPQVQLALDLDRVAGSGALDLVAGADTQVANAARWEYLLQTRFGSGNGTVAIWPGAGGGPSFAGSSAQNADGTMELAVPWSALGLAAVPPRLRATVATFRSSTDDTTKEVAGSDALDVVSDYGDPGTAPGTGAEVGDGIVDYFADVALKPDGEVQAPLVVASFMSSATAPNEGAEWVEVANATMADLNVSAFKLGDGTTPGAESMYSFPTGTILSPAERFRVARSGAAHQAKYGTLPDAEFLDTSTAPNMNSYAPWSAGVFDLEDAGDEIVVLDGSNTTVDVVPYGAGVYAGVGTLAAPALDGLLGRNASLRDTDTVADFSAAACAGTKTWDGGGGNGSWHTPQNWSGDTLPGPADHVCIADQGLPEITHTSGVTTTILSLTSAETIRQTAGTLNLTSTVQESSIANYRLAGGSVSGAARLVIPQTFEWSGGDFRSNGVTVFPASSAVQLFGASHKDVFDTRRIENRSGAPLEFGGAGQIRLDTNTVFENYGVFELDEDADLGPWNCCGIFRNFGTVRKVGGVGESTFDARFNNTGQVIVDSGTLAFTRDGTHTGPFTISNGGLRFGGGTQAFAAAISGSPGTSVRFSGGTNTLNGPFSVPSVLVDTTGTTTITANATPTAISTLSISAARINIDDNVSVTALTQGSGTLGGSGSITVNGAFSWSGGDQTDTGTTTITDGATMTLSGGDHKDMFGSRRIVNNSDSAVEWTGTGSIRLDTSTIFDNHGVINLQGDQQIGLWNCCGLFRNFGTLRKASGAGESVTDARFNNAGQVIVDSGQLAFNRDGTHTGSFVVNSGGLRFSASTQTSTGPITGAAGTSVSFTGGTFTQSGTFDVPTVHSTGGTATLTNAATTLAALNVSGSGRVNFSEDISPTNVTQTAGTIGGNGDLIVSGTLNWQGGDMTDGGVTSVSPGAQLLLSGAGHKDLFGSRRLLNRSTTPTTWTGSGSIRIDANAVFENDGVIDIQGDQDISLWNCCGTFQNDGTLRKSAGNPAVDDTFVDVGFRNTGSLEVNVGRMRLNRGSAGTSTGSYVSQAADSLWFENGTHTLGPTSSVTGPGTVRFIHGTTTISGAYDVDGPTQVVGGGAVNFMLSGTGDSVPASMHTLQHSGGTLGGNDVVEVSDALTWSGGTQSGDGLTRLLASGVATLSGTRTLSDARTFENLGSVTWTSPGTWTVGGGAGGTIRNLGSWTFGDGQQINHGGGVVDFVNQPGAKITKIGTANGSTTNHGAEFDAGSTDGGVVGISNWTRPSGSNATIVRYNAVGFPTTAQAPPNAGANFFSGGPNNASSTLTQGIDISGHSFNIDRNAIGVRFEADLGGEGAEDDATTAHAVFLDGSGAEISRLTLAPVLAAERGGVTGFVHRLQTGTVPVGTRSVRLEQVATRGVGGSPYNNGYADNIRIAFKTPESWFGSSSIDIPFHNESTVAGGGVQIDHGALNLEGGSGSASQVGSYVVSDGGSLMFGGDTHSLAPASSITGLGSVLATAGTVHSGGTIQPRTTTISGGTINYNTASTTEILRLFNGCLCGSANFTVTGSGTWWGGTQGGAGKTTIPAGVGLSIPAQTADRWLDTRTIENAGTVDFTAPNQVLRTLNGATVSNLAGAVWNFAGDGDFDYWSGAVSTFANAGQVVKTAGTSDGVSNLDLAYNSSGVTKVDSGFLRIARGGTSAGAFQIAAPGNLDFNSNTSLTAPSSVTGAGTVRFIGGDSAIASGTYDVNTTSFHNSAAARFIKTDAGDTTPATSTTLSLASTGGLGGDDVFTVGTGGATWTAGSLYGTGKLVVPPGRTLSIPAQSGDRWLDTRTLENSGTVNFTAPNQTIRVLNGSTVSNLGVWNFAGDGDFDYWSGVGPTFVNSGEVVKTAGTSDGISNIDIAYNSSGLTRIDSGSFRLTRAGTSSGVFQLAAPANLDFNSSAVFTGASSVTGPGAVRVLSSTPSIAGTYDVAATSITGGSNPQFDDGAVGDVSPAMTDTLTFATTSGLGGTGDLLIRNAGSWTGGSMAGSGTTLLAEGATFTIPAQTSDRWIGDTRRLETSGTVNFTAPNQVIRTLGSAAIRNTPTGVWNFGDADFEYWSGTVLPFQNEGTIVKTGNGESVMPVNVTNTGTLDIRGGSFRITQSLTNYNNGTKTLTGGTYKVTDPGVLRFPNADVQTSAASIVLSGGTAPLTTPSITDTVATPADALRAFRTNAAGGDFSIVSGRNLPAVGTPNTLTNLGTLRGTGTYFRNVTNSGVVAPGASPGILTVDGMYTQSPTGTLEIEVGGTTNPGTLFDQLVVTGAATLNGKLTGRLFGGFVPVTGVGIDVVTAASRTGTFNVVDSVPMPLPGNLLPEARYDETTAKLFAVPGGGAADDSVSEGAGTKSITVTLSAASSEPVTVHYATENGTADAADFTNTSGDLLFPAGHTSKSFDVAITDDSRDEPDQTFRVHLSSPANTVLTDTLAEVTISDNDDLPSLSIADHQQAEGSFGPNTFTIPVTLSSVSEKSVTVTYQTVEDDGTAENDATEGVDFTAAGGTVVFQPGEIAKSVGIDIAGDVFVEFDEDFFVDLSLPLNATLAKPRSTVAIVDDDQGVAASKLSIGDVALAESDAAQSAVFTVNLAPMSAVPVSVNATAVGGSATGGSDFASTTQLLTFAPGETSKQFVVPITGDNLDEATETYGVVLSGAIDGVVDDGFALGTITDDDHTPSLVTEAILVAPEDAVNFEFGLTGEDTDDAALTYTIVDPPLNGLMTGPAAGSNIVRYTPPQNFTGFDSFTVRVSDGTNSSTGAYQIQVTPVNDAPVVGGESRDVLEDGFVDVDVLANDSDVDGDVLTIHAVGPAAHGTVEQRPDGRTLRYRPAANYNGADSFQYTVRDGAGGLVNGTVSVQVTPVNDAPVAQDQAATTAEETPKVITLGASDVETADLARSVVSGPAHGSLGPIVGNQITYTPDVNYTGVDTFRFKVNDGGLDSGPATVSVTVTPVNDAPTATDISAELFEDSIQAVTLPATDVDGDALTYAIVASPGQGSLSGLSGNQVTYSPDPNFFGSDSFSFRASDGTSVSNVAVVSLTVQSVNDPPVAVDDSGTVAEDTPFADIPVLHNDSDVDPQGLSFQSVGTPLHGTAVGQGDGTVRYTPHANYNGPDSFPYTVQDSAGGTATGTVFVTVTPVNDRPVAVARTAAVAQGVAEAIALQAVDIDGQPLTYAIVSGPAKGTISPPSGNVVTYTADAAATGNDTFSFTASDGTETSDPATVTVSISSSGGGAVSQIAIDNVTQLEGDSGTSALTFTVTRSLAGSGPASVGYATVGATAAEGSDYAATSGTLDFPTGVGSRTVTVDVLGDRRDEADESVFLELSGASGASLLDGQGRGVITDDDDAPVAGAQSLATAEDTPRVVVLGATDGDADTISYTIVDGPNHGTLDGAGADRTYTPDPNYHGPDSFTFRASDGVNDSNVATIALNVTSVNDVPVAEDGSVATVQNRAVTVTLRATDADGDPLTYSADAETENGTVSIEGSQATYTPDTGFTGADSFAFQVSDGQGGLGFGSVEVDVVPAGGATTASVADVAISEADDEAVFTLALSNAANGARIRVTTDDDTANAASDYTAASATYTFTGGATSEQFIVKLKDDALDEDDERFRVNIEVEAGGVIAPDAVAFGTIADNDASPSLSIGNATLTEGDAGTQTAQLTVALSAVSGRTVQVDYSTADGTATAADGDYTPTSGRLTFAAGETTKTIGIAVHGDPVVELNEALSVVLSNASNAALGGSSGAIAITNDDSLVPLPPAPPPIPAPPTADLSIAMSAPATSAVDQNVTYAITVKNNGPDAATSVVVSDALPAGLQFVSASVGQIACSGGATITCPVGALAVGATAPVMIVATTTEPGVHTNTATVSGAQADPAAANNSASATTRVPVPVVREPQGRNSKCTQAGTSGNDVLRGTPGRDVICGFGGNDVLIGFGGDDRLLGGLGDDKLYGGTGKDVLRGGNGSDLLQGGAGADNLDGGRGRDTLRGGLGADLLNGSFGDDNLAGGKGRDRVLGGPGKDRMQRDGQDVALGGPGGDRCVVRGAITVCA